MQKNIKIEVTPNGRVRCPSDIDTFVTETQKTKEGKLTGLPSFSPINSWFVRSQLLYSSPLPFTSLKSMPSRIFYSRKIHFSFGRSCKDLYSVKMHPDASRFRCHDASNISSAFQSVVFQPQDFRTSH